ncbi:MAG: hypothetical protein HPY60_11780 [Candidatus Methanofastidiosum sp.]|nr:hypothetical protein [Methanofastidiosum sp.]
MKVNLNKSNLKIILFVIISLTFLNIILHFITYANTLNQFYIIAHISLIVTLMFNIFLNQKYDKNVNYFSTYLVITLILIGLSSYSHRNFYRPFKWVKDCSIGFHLTNNEEVSNEKVMDFCRCRYEIFLKKYQEINKFPNECSYTKQDIYDMYYCMINELLDDSVRNYHLEKIEIYVDEYSQELKEKCN